MAYPEDELPVVIQIAPGASPTGNPGTWPWVDVTDRIRERTNITITDGQGDWSSRPNTSIVGLTFNNDTGDFSEYNPLGEWFGLLGRDTPLRARLRRGEDDFTGRTVSSGLGTSTSGQAWSVASGAASAWSVGSNVATCSISAANSVRRVLFAATLLDAERRFTITPPATLTGGALIWRFLVRYIDSNNFYALTVELNPGGTVTCRIRRNLDSTTSTLISSDPVPALTYTAGQPVHMRAGIEDVHLGVKAWVGSLDDEPLGWSVEIDDYALGEPGQPGEDLMLAAGNSNSLPYAVTLDSYQLDVDLGGGWVPAWVPKWQAMGTDRIVPVVAKGVLERSSPATGTPPIISALRQYLSQFNLVGHWTFEDGSNATVAASALPNGSPASVNNVSFGSDTSLPGASTTTVLHPTSGMSGYMTPLPDTGYVGVIFFFKLTEPPGAKSPLLSVYTTGTVWQWVISADATTYYVDGYTAAQASVISLAIPFLDTPPDQWVAVQVTTSQSGANVDVDATFWHVSADDALSTDDSGTYAGDAGAPTNWSIGAALDDGACYSHLVFLQEEVDFTDLAWAAAGWANELVVHRMERMAAAENVRMTVTDGLPAPVTQLGRQAAIPFVDNAFRVADADGGLLYERPFRLHYAPLARLYNQEPTLTLSSSQLGAEPEPDPTDQRYRNRWEVSRIDGSAAVAEAPEVRQGAIVYGDSAQLNLASDGQLPNQAGWRLGKTANRQLAWPRLSINLMKTPELIDQWLCMRTGRRMVVSDPPADVAGQPPDVVLLGSSSVLGYKGWDVAMNCASALPLNVGVRADTTRGRRDTAGAELASDALTGATSLSVTTTLGPLWVTGSVDFDVSVGGVRVHVTNISGSGPQAFTVTGADVIRDLPAGTPVRLWTPARRAL